MNKPRGLARGEGEPVIIHIAELIATSLLLLLQLIMMSMGLSLFLKSSSRRYLWLSGSFILGTASSLTLFINRADDSIDHIWLIYSMLHCLSFIFIHMSFYQLFDRKNKKPLKIYGVCAAAVGLASLSLFFIETSIADNISNACMFIMSLFFLIWIAPKFSLTKYSMGLYAFVAASLLLCFENFWPLLIPVALCLYVIGYYLLLLVFFDFIVEIVQQISISSSTDGLTGLFNRKYFDKQTTKHIELGSEPSIIFSDIDNFKKLNDTKGHDVGDEMLKFVANILMEEAEGVGLAGRYGGEETVLLITDPSVDVSRIAENIRHRIEEESERLTPITVSVGYSHYSEDIHTLQLIKQADEAMYLAKTTGKNKVCSFNMVLECQGELHLENSNPKEEFLESAEGHPYPLQDAAISLTEDISAQVAPETSGIDSNQQPEIVVRKNPFSK